MMRRDAACSLVLTDMTLSPSFFLRTQSALSNDEGAGEFLLRDIAGMRKRAASE